MTVIANVFHQFRLFALLRFEDFCLNGCTLMAGCPPELLFEWRRDHERSVLERLGKAGVLRQKVIDRRLEGFENVTLSVRGKGMSRILVATSNVGDYLERIRGISPVNGLDDPVFCTREGEVAKSLYHGALERLLIESKLLLSSSGKRRSTYCFRHTYATFRLSEGVDALFLAHQMGTSVKMIQDHYGHITPLKNAERILQGMPGWMTVPGVGEA